MRIRRKRVTEPVPSDILFVCTGNICRSAFLEAVTRQRHPTLTVRSAGTGALVGAPVPEPIETLLARRGIPIDHAGKQITTGLIAGARLIITATAEQRSYVVSLDAGAADRTFALLELARFLAAAPAPASISPAGSSVAGDGVDAAVAAGREALAHDSFDHADDLPDPYRRPMAAFERMAETIDGALAVIDPWLAS